MKMNQAYTFIKYLFLFFTGGIGYYYLEIWYRGTSHYSMLICGGLCFLFIGGLNEQSYYTFSFFQQMLLGAIIITTLELLTGILVNRIFHLNVWNYEGLPFNFLGQICLSYSTLWFFLSAIIIVLDDYLRVLLFLETPPTYFF